MRYLKKFNEGQYGDGYHGLIMAPDKIIPVIPKNFYPEKEKDFGILSDKLRLNGKYYFEINHNNKTIYLEFPRHIYFKVNVGDQVDINQSL